MNIIITGGSGFIGTNLISFLVSQSYITNIVCIDILPPKFVNHKLIFINADIRKDLKIKLDFDIDILIHLAALCKEPGYDWDAYFYTNYFGTKNVINLSNHLKIKKIIFTSTMMTYRAGDKVNSEEDLTSPDTAYGISKLLAEETLISWTNRDPSNKLIILRLGVVFGIGENANFTRLVKSLLRGTFLFVGKNTTIKGNVYVKEVINLINKILLNEISLNHIVYNFVFPDDSSIGRIVNIIKEVLNIKRFVPIMPYKILLFLSYFFSFVNSIGIKNSIHPRRIQKLFFSTHISPQRIIEAGYVFKYSLYSAISNWLAEDKFK